MQIRTVRQTLRLKHPWKIAREETRETVDTVRVEIEHEGLTGYGEAFPSAYYHDETLETVEQVASKAEAVIGKDPFLLEDITEAFDMKVMIGCMPESSIAITAAAHLTPLTEYADLDMNLLVSDDPFDGVHVKDGKLVLPDRPGIGVTPN